MSGVESPGGEADGDSLWLMSPSRPFRSRDSLAQRIASGRTRFFTDLLEEDKLSAALEQHRNLADVARAFESHAALIDLDRVRSGGEQEILSIEDCRLIEQRKGARVTVSSRETTSTGSWSSSGVGIRVGRVSVSGRSGSSSRSSSSSGVSISYPAPDVLQEIDAGTVRLTTRRIAFIGQMFTRNTDFRKILGFSTDDERSLLIAPETRSKVWIIETPTNEARAFLQIMLMAAESRRRELGGILDRGYVTRYGVDHPLVEVLAAARDELADALAQQMDAIHSIASSRGLPPDAWRDRLGDLPPTMQGWSH